MALIRCDFKSETLGLSCSLNAILNQQALRRSATGRSPVLYLLHGLTEDHTAWTRRSSIERYAEQYDVAVVMPAVHRSFYTDMKTGYPYWQFISEELPALCRDLLPIATERENTFVAGLSMGGYGAFKLALSHPDRFAAAASLSGALDLWRLSDQKDELLPEWKAVFGSPDEFLGSPNDLMALAARAAQSGQPLPALFQCCGTEDKLYGINQTFRIHCQAIGLPLHYEEETVGHEWAYWDRAIQKVLAWLPLARLDAPEPTCSPL